MDQGLHIGILENDFGAINVDMLMLHELRGDQCELEMIAGGCDAESHRRRFRTKLISMRMCGYDRVLVEPSGIFDVDEFFDALREEPLDQWYEIGNVIAILDARLEDNLSEQADYLLASEAANAGKVILSHADAATREQCEDTVTHLNRALEQIRCDRRIDPKKDILQKNLTDLTKEDLEEVSKCGYRLESYRKMDLENGQSFDSLFFMEEKIKPEALERAVPRLFADKSCGEVFRIKGFVKNGAGQWMELNATPDSHTMQSVAVGQEVLIVIGEHLQEDKIREILKEEETCQSYCFCGGGLCDFSGEGIPRRAGTRYGYHENEAYDHLQCDLFPVAQCGNPAGCHRPVGKSGNTLAVASIVRDRCPAL